jgi:hypothetical protein
LAEKVTASAAHANVPFDTVNGQFWPVQGLPTSDELIEMEECVRGALMAAPLDGELEFMDANVTMMITRRTK